MNEKPDLVRWNIGAYRVVNGTLELSKSFYWCDHCQSGSLYGWTVTSREICVPAVAVPCLGLDFNAEFTLDLNGFAAFLIDHRGKPMLFATDSGRLPNRDPTLPYHLNKTLVEMSECNSMTF